MKKIICYGDSNTFGFNPDDGSRFDEKIRWTSLLQNKLGSRYKIINEGTCDRTGFADNPKGGLYSAQRHLPKVIDNFGNIEILILALGTNDLQFQYNISFNAIEAGLEKLIKLAKSKTKNTIIIPPIILNEDVLIGNFKFQFDKTSIEKSKKVRELYKQITNENHCLYFDINNFTKPSKIDGLHYDKNSHKIIADKLAKFILDNKSGTSTLPSC